MSPQDRLAVRQPLTLGPSSRRRLEERLALRFPWATPFAVRAVLRLPARSRLRRSLARRYVRIALEAWNRGDFRAAYALHHPQVEARYAAGFVGLGFDPVYHGREQHVRAQREVAAELRIRLTTDELVDVGGNRLLVLGRTQGEGGSSHAPFQNEWGLLVTLVDGFVVREEFFFDCAEALAAAGLASQP